MKTRGQPQKPDCSVIVARAHRRWKRWKIARHGYAEKLEETLRLPRWKPEEILTLAEQVLGPSQRQHAPRLAELADRCPLLVVLGGALIASGNWPEAMTGGEAFRERVFRSFKEDFLSRQPASRRERLGRLIGILSFVSPAPKNETLRNTDSKIINCSPMDVAQDLESLDAAGLVVENREGVSYPDLCGRRSRGRQSRSRGQAVVFHAEFFETGDQRFPALMKCRPGRLGARAQKGANCSLFDPIWKEFVRRFDSQMAESTQCFRSGCWSAILTFKTRCPDRDNCSVAWASFAVYLPEKTLELSWRYEMRRLRLAHGHAPRSQQCSRFRVCCAAFAAEANCDLAF